MSSGPWKTEYEKAQDLAVRRVTREQLAQTNARNEMARSIIDADPPHCKYCGMVVPKPRRYKGQVRYCNDEHALLAQQQRAKERSERRRALAGTLADNFLETAPDSVRRGPIYDRLKEELSDKEWIEWAEGRLSSSEVARRFGYQPSSVVKARRAAHDDLILDLATRDWEPDQEAKGFLGPSDQEMAALAREDPEAFVERLEVLVDSFVAWRERFFTVGFETSYITKPMHRKWIANTLRTIYTGGRQMILSPPRHGKTDLLIHFCVWLICRNPNIRILWVGPSQDIAENCLGQVRDLLSDHAELGKMFLRPSTSWAPQKRTGALWSRNRFTVANRTLTLKQPSMWCTGVGGRLLSIDADFIIVDDPADPDASQLPSGREKIEKWFKIKLMTRKMHHTGLVMISSRVHPDDLYSLFVDSERWAVTVDRAHDQSICHKHLWDPHGDDITSCVLFPEMNPLEYLREQADVVGDGLFEMMYLNQPRPEGTVIFEIDLIRELCLDYSRSLGVDTLAPGYRLVAGLDPASRGVQAAFCWAVYLPDDGSEPGPLGARRRQRDAIHHMVDLETQRAGGPDGAHRVMREWAEAYDCRIWVVEDNAYQSVFFDDPRTKALAAELSLTIQPTHTGKNKHDPDFGVAGMAPLYHEGKVILPYADVDAKRKTEMLLRQLSGFTGDTKSSTRRKAESDILMASWFPHATVIKKWRKDAKHSEVQQLRGASFSGYVAPTWGEAPWGNEGGTTYPY